MYIAGYFPLGFRIAKIEGSFESSKPFRDLRYSIVSLNAILRILLKIAFSIRLRISKTFIRISKGKTHYKLIKMKNNQKAEHIILNDKRPLIYVYKDAIKLILEL